MYLSFVQGDRHGYIWILLHTAHYLLCQYHLLKMLSFILCIILVSLSKNSVSIGGFTSWSSILLIYLSFFMPIPHCFYYYTSIVALEIRFFYCIVKKNAKKKLHTSSELSIIKGCIFRGMFLCMNGETGTKSSSQKREDEHMLCIAFVV